MMKPATRRAFLRGAGAPLAPRHSDLNPRLCRCTHPEDQPCQPRIRPLSRFAETDDHIRKSINKKFAGSIRNKGKTWPIEILSNDSQSKPNRAAAVACELIRSEEVDAIVAVSTPDMVNPMSDQADLNRAPCVAAACPRQSSVFDRGSIAALARKDTLSRADLRAQASV